MQETPNWLGCTDAYEGNCHVELRLKETGPVVMNWARCDECAEFIRESRMLIGTVWVTLRKLYFLVLHYSDTNT